MTNEEKILAILEQLSSDVSGTKADMAGMKADMAGMKADMSILKDRMDRLEVTLENDIKPTQQLILETLVPLTQKVKEVERIPPIEERVDVLEASVRHLANEIQRLKKAQ